MRTDQAQPAAVQSKGALGRGDLLRLLKLGLAPEAAGDLLGYRPPESPAAHASTEMVGGAARVGVAESLSLGEEVSAQVIRAPTAPPLWRVIGPDVTVTDSENQIPKCLRAGPACSEAALSNRTDEAPEVRPLLNVARLGVTLRGLLLREGETDEVDDVRLVDELARCRTPSSVPRRVRRSWPARIQILWDQSSALRPLRHDQVNVVQWLRRWRGELGLEELIVGERRSPEWHRRIGRGDLARVVVLPRKRPDAGTTLLALSDLGCLNQDVARCEFWTSEVHQAVKAGAQCRALVPGPPARWNRSLARRWGARDWERGTRKRTGAARPTSA
jgi:hypothetical protein